MRLTDPAGQKINRTIVSEKGHLLPFSLTTNQARRCHLLGGRPTIRRLKYLTKLVYAPKNG